MSSINLGAQFIVFDFKQPAKAEGFNHLLRDIIRPGLMKGGTLSLPGGPGSNVVRIAPFAAIVYTDTNKAIVVHTLSDVEVNVTEAQPCVYCTFTWQNITEDWLDFGKRAVGAPVAQEICFGQPIYSGGITTGAFSYDEVTFSFKWSDTAAELLVNGDIIPYITGSFTLGDAAHRFKELYLASKIDYQNDIEFWNGGTKKLTLKTDGRFYNSEVLIGTIVAWVPGYFTNGSNAGFTDMSGSISVPDWWKFCDGSLCNDADSPIFNGAGRYLPNLSDSRFLMGSTVVGQIGGANTLSAHTHGINSQLGNITLGHTHYNNDHSHTVTNHDHGMAHYHGMSSHSHDEGSLFACLNAYGDENIRNWAVQGAYIRGTIHTDSYHTRHNMAEADCDGIRVTGSTGGPSTNATEGASAVVTGGSAPGTGGSTDRYMDSRLSDYNASHTHSITSTTAPESRPVYLSCKYMMRIK